MADGSRLRCAIDRADQSADGKARKSRQYDNADAAAPRETHGSSISRNPRMGFGRQTSPGCGRATGRRDEGCAADEDASHALHDPRASGTRGASWGRSSGVVTRWDLVVPAPSRRAVSASSLPSASTSSSSSWGTLPSSLCPPAYAPSCATSCPTASSSSRRAWPCAVRPSH